MITEELQILLIAILTSATCAIPGVFLVLRRMSLMSDAISHSVLLGIVLAFFVLEDLGSPLLIIGAGLAGLLTAALVEILESYTKVKTDACIGMIFPALFSIGVILINMYASDVHLDNDAVLLGELAFAPFNTIDIGGVITLPKSLAVMLFMFLLNLAFVGIFYKELKLSAFDAGLATSLGFFPMLIHYIFMGVVSVTAVGAFDSVGSILVVAFMITPPCGAYMLTNRLSLMLFLSVFIGIVSCFIGYGFAKWFDTSIAGCIATLNGIIFLVIVLIAPKRGIIAQKRTKFRQKLAFARSVMLVHLSNHVGSEFEAEQCSEAHLSHHIHWDDHFAAKVINSAVRMGLVNRQNGVLTLTPSGMQTADDIMEV